MEETQTEQQNAEVLPAIWPQPLVEQSDELWPDLSPSASDLAVEKWVLENKKILIRTITWNLCARPPPTIDALQSNLIPQNKFHIYIVGSEECERSIAKSALNPSKKIWEAYLKDAIGPNYLPFRSHTLQAIHLIGFVHKAVAHLCTNITSVAVPTGVGGQMGNKGGVGLNFELAGMRALIVNAHLAAHQNAEGRRNAEFKRINKAVPLMVSKKLEKAASKAAGTGLFSGFNLLSSRNPKVGFFSYSTKDGTSSTSSNSGDMAELEGDGSALIGVASFLQPEGTASSEGPGGTTVQPSVSPNSTGHFGRNLSMVVENTGGESPRGGPEGSNTSATVPAPEAVVATEDKLNIPDSEPTISPETQHTEGAEPDTQQASLGVETTLLDTGVDESVAGADNGAESELHSVNKLDGRAILDVPVTDKTLENSADLVVFMGDLNYRIKGNRKIVSSLLQNNLHEVLVNNDQLAFNMKRQLVLQGFTEGPLNFKPTYKFDLGTSNYDTSSKGRIPSWTDRILFVPRNPPPEPIIGSTSVKLSAASGSSSSSRGNSGGSSTRRVEVKCLAYNSDDSLRTSDHRPVYASFSVSLPDVAKYIKLDELSIAGEVGVRATSAEGGVPLQENQSATSINENATTATPEGGFATSVENNKSSTSVRAVSDKKNPEFTSESQVCVIM